MADYFTEVFPIHIDKIGQLTAYTVAMTSGRAIDAVMDDLLVRLRKAFTGQWVWTGVSLITDDSPSPIQIEITLDVLQKELPQIFGHIDSITEQTGWQPTAEDAAEYITHLSIQKYDQAIRQLLRTHGTRIRNGYVMRDYILRAWEVDGAPALSFSLQSRLLSLQNVQTTLEQDHDVVGLTVIDKTDASKIGTITALNGYMKEQRSELLVMTEIDAKRTLIEAAEDTTQVVTVAFEGYSRDYAASSLNIILNENNYTTFGIESQSVQKAMTLAPDIMASIVSSTSDILKDKGVIGNAYNNRSHQQHFMYLDHVPEMEFGNKAVRPYQIETLAKTFATHRLFANHPRFRETPIRIAVLNTLDSTLAHDFVEAMRRQLERDFGFDIEMIKQRNVRVISDKNLASAVRVIEKEDPHILLACFADNQAGSYDYVHSLTLGKGIALQALYEKTIHNPDAMNWVIMGVLAKTGNTPFVLAEPLDAAQLIVGLDWVRESLTRGDRIVGMSRVYRRDGYFMRYFKDQAELETDGDVPSKIMETLFPAPIFKGKRVLVHHRGTLERDMQLRLDAWAKTIDATFFYVEIHTENVPHLYALDNGVGQAPWGSVYLLNAVEAFVISSSPDSGTMPEPIHVRVRSDNVTIEQAVYSILALTLLSYGTATLPRMPVTIQNGDKLAEWFARGMVPDDGNGDVAFWL